MTAQWSLTDRCTHQQLGRVRLLMERLGGPLLFDLAAPDPHQRGMSSRGPTA